MSSFSTINKKIAKAALKPNLSTEMDSTTKGEPNHDQIHLENEEDELMVQSLLKKYLTSPTEPIECDENKKNKKRSSSDSNQIASSLQKKKKKRRASALGSAKKKAASAPSAPVKKNRNDYENLLKMPEANQTAELNGYKIEGILKSVNSRDLRLMSNETLKELKYQLKEALWDQKAWCEHVECSRETAIAQGELGGYCSGEFGPYYFFFAPTKAAEFTSEQRGMLGDHIACCFMNNQPCACQLDEDHDGDPCECKMGDSNGSFWFEMGLGPETFDQECSEGLIKAKWILSTDSDCLPWTSDVEKLYNEAQLKEAIGDFNQFDADKLARVAKYLAKPIGKLVLNEKQSISSHLETWS